MTKTIYALDTEFSAATGASVNSGVGTSQFDSSPAGTTNLVITSNSGDSNPFVFSVGDVYTVSFDGIGATTIQSATVVRSDTVSSGGRTAVVFEGLDSSGNLAQVIWTPGYDLESWYFANFSGGLPPVFYTGEQDPATYQYVCFTSGTRIDTPDGPIPVQHLRSGQRVLTADNGSQEILWTGHRTVVGVGPAAPVVLEAGVIGNMASLAVSQQHRLMLKHPLAELYFDTSEVLVPAKALVNGTSARLQARKRVTYHHILLENHELLWAQGAVAESLYLGDVARNRILATDRAPTTHMSIATRDADPPQMARPCLTFFEARFLATEMGIAAGPVAGTPPMLIAA